LAQKYEPQVNNPIFAHSCIGAVLPEYDVRLSVSTSVSLVTLVWHWWIVITQVGMSAILLHDQCQWWAKV